VNTPSHTEVRSPPGNVSCIVIGAGQAGLSISYCLDERGIDHLILERGEIANTWRTERWDSLRLLTPNWQCQLPGYAYRGKEPDGFMPVAELISFFDGYTQHIRAPIHTNTEVLEVSPVEGGYLVVTNKGSWRCKAVVVASGAYNTPTLPRCSAEISRSIRSLTTLEYRGPGQLEDGGVLVVGASATGVQLAREIQHSGRAVTLCVGEHVRMPRRYRGQDILTWMDRVGLLDESYQEVDDIQRARRVPSPQLVGMENGSSLDLNRLSDEGVRLVGRLAGVHNNTLQFSGSLHNICKLADLKMNRLLRGIDEWIHEAGLESECPEAEDIPNTVIAEDSPLELGLACGEIKTVIWACGFRPDYSWLKVPVLNRKGHIEHDGGISTAPGLYTMGLPYMRRRKSSFIYGTADDARDISDHLQGHIRQDSKSQRYEVA
jgi:putative flavoprotein involved in K+ transport